MKAPNPGWGFVLLAGFKALAEHDEYLRGMKIIPCEDGKTVIMTIAVEGGAPLLIEAALDDMTIEELRHDLGPLIDDDALLAMEPEGRA